VSDRNRPDIPSGMEKVYRRLEHWRETRRGRSPIPKQLWAAAAAVARKHGVNRTSKVLHLEFKKLKGFVESLQPRKGTATHTPQFVELMTSRPAGFSECIIELEGRHGKMRIEWKGITASDLAELSHVLWERA
jgi:hypothetical protein